MMENIWISFILHQPKLPITDYEDDDADDDFDGGDDNDDDDEYKYNSISSL